MDSDSQGARSDNPLDAQPAGLTPEQHYERTSSAAARRQRGQFFTPPAVAAAMVRWACPDALTGDFLDPAAGAGIFIRQALALRPARALSYYGYDIDADVLKLAQATLPPAAASVQLSVQDFLMAPIGRKFAAIVCNPPYIKHHAIPGKAAVFARLRAGGLDLPQTTNYYCLFLLRACQLLDKNGRCAFIIPSEFLNADYGVAVKRHLLASGLLRGILLFDFETQVFDGILTTACILLLENSRPVPDIRLAALHDPQALPDLLEHWEAGDSAWRRKTPTALDPSRKWRNYFHEEGPAADSLAPLGRLARCMRGIATGCNEYFTLSRQELAQYRLPPSSVRRCVARARDAVQLVFDEAQFEGLAAQQRKVYLIDFGDRPGTAEQAYLARGETLGVPQRFLPRHRRVWHAPENRPAADLWVQVFSRGGVRFILNAANVANLTCFHGLYLTPAGRPFRLLLWLYLNTPTCQTLMRQERREYGGGLEKFEPRDIERLLAPDFTHWPAGVIMELTRLGDQLRGQTRLGGGDVVVAEADALIRRQLYGADPA